MSGSVLLEMFPDKFEELMLKVRKRLAMGTFKRETTSYWLLLALDLASKNWQKFPEPLATFYAAKIGKSNVMQLQAAIVATTPGATTPGSRSGQRSGGSSGVRGKEYWQHDDRANDSGRKEEKVPQGRPLHGTGRSASKGSKEKDSPLPHDESTYD